jgi:hypothetical protein
MRTLRKKRHAARLRARRLLILTGAVALALVGALATTANSALSASAAQQPAKHYKATRAFVQDKATGRVRMPTQAEVDEVVATLSALGQRPAEELPQSTQSGGTVTVDLEGSQSGIVLARPNEDGTWETRCVFTIEEGAAFLGLVPDDSVR